MKKITLLLLIAMICSISSSYGQKTKVKIKKGIVFVEGKECLNIASSWGECTLIDKEGNDILHCQWFLKTDFHPAYRKIIFLREKVTITNYSTPFSKKNLIQNLIASKVLVDCEFNPENIDWFALKYDEEIPTSNNINVNVND